MGSSRLWILDAQTLGSRSQDRSLGQGARPVPGTVKGATSPSESSACRDRATGALVYQMTGAEAISHPTYFLQSSFLPGDREILFISYRTGSAQLFTAGFPK